MNRKVTVIHFTCVYCGKLFFVKADYYCKYWRARKRYPVCMVCGKMQPARKKKAKL
jgi:hypothetical protein